jgi:hypothetical protein
LNPQLYTYTPPGEKTIAVLVDEDSLVRTRNDEGDLHTHYLSAVYISWLHVGMIHDRQLATRDAAGDVVMGEKFLWVPRPVVWEMRREMDKGDFRSRGIQPRAATVLLHLAGAANRAAAGSNQKGWSFGKAPALRGVPVGWDKWKFLAAWQWSYWQNHWMKGPQQHLNMQNLGYPEDEGRLRTMISRLGLSKK